MKVFALFLGFSLGMIHAQTNAQIAFVTTAPSGSCTARANLRLRTPNGTLYSCQSGTWGILVSGATSPASPVNSVQFNSSGSFGGDANLTWDSTNALLTSSGKITSTVSFTGTGLNDLTASYDSTFGQKCYNAIVTITAIGTPDSFEYNCDGATQTTNVSITGSDQYLGDGLTIHFGSTTGHTNNVTWIVRAVGNGVSRSTIGSSFIRILGPAVNLSNGLFVYENYTDLPQPVFAFPIKLMGMEYDGGKMGMTQPLVSFDFLPHIVDSGTVTTAIGPRLANQTVGTTANCNLVVGSNSDAACPAGDWEIVGTTAKPSRLGGNLEAPSITITGSSFSLNGMTCTIVAGAIACS